MVDHVINAATAVTLQAEAAQLNTLFAWVVSRYQRDYPGKFVARLVTRHLGRAAGATSKRLTTLRMLTRRSARCY